MELTEGSGGPAAARKPVPAQDDGGRAASQPWRAAGEPLPDDVRHYWHLDRAHGGDPALVINYSVEILGQVDPAAVAAAFAAAVAEEPALRVCFPLVDGEPRVAERADRSPPPFEVVDLAGAGCEADTVWARRIRAEYERPFDVTQGPLYRLLWFSMGEGRAVLSVVAHHAASDLRSIILLIWRVLGARPPAPGQAGGPFRLPATARRGREDEANRAYWRRRLGEIDLSPAFGETAGRTHRRASSLAIYVPSALRDAVFAFADRTATMAGTVLGTAFRVFLGDLSKRESFPLLNALDTTHRENRHRLHLAAVPVPIEGKLSPERSFLEALDDTGQQTRAALRHRRIGIDVLAGLAPPHRRYAPELMFSFLEQPAAPAGLVVRPREICRPATDFELALWAGSDPERTFLMWCLEGNAERFSATALETLAARFETLLGALLASPDRPVGDVAATLAPAPPPEGWQGPTVRIASNVVDAPLAPHLSAWADRLGMAVRFSFAGFDQVFRELLDPASEMRGNARGLAVVLFKADAGGAGRPGEVAARLEELSERIAEAAPSLSTPLLLVLAPVDPAFLEEPGRAGELFDAEARLAARLSGIAGVTVLERGTVQRHDRPSAPWRPGAAARAASIPCEDAGFAILATRIVRFAHETLRRPVKVVVADCDNTLWGGVVGEDGVEGLRLGPGHLALQRRLKEAVRRGLVLCLASKNIEEDVLSVFARRRDMILTREDVTLLKVDWRAKSESIREIAAELDLAPEAIVFLDDNPAEIAEVSLALPEVAAVAVDPDAPDFPAFVEGLWLLDRSAVTAEDARRSRMYREEAERKSVRRAAADYASFVAGLGIVATARTPADGEIGRVAQLTARTNQFNPSRRPWSEADVRRVLSDPHAHVLVLDVSDRFGSYGLVGLIAGRRRAGGVFAVEQFLMSCRVLGRGVEHRMVRELGRLAGDIGCGAIEIPLVETARNEPVRRFLSELPAERRAADGAWVVSIAAGDAAGIVFDPAAARRAVERHEEDRREALAAGDPAEGAGALVRDAAPAIDGATWAGVARAGDDPGRLEAFLFPERAVPSHVGPAASAASADRRERSDGVPDVAALLSGILGGRPVDRAASLEALGVPSMGVIRLLLAIESASGVALKLDDLSVSASPADIEALIAARLAGAAAGDAPAPGRVAAEDALAAMADLPLSRRTVPVVRASAERPADPPRDVFLTGATGFLGGHILAELLAETDARVTCLLRARGEAEGLERVVGSLRDRGFGHLADAARARVRPICGSLEAPFFGLDRARFLALCYGLDMVIHNGASVSFTASYRDIRAANVLGTRTALHLAATGRRKTMHFVSTVAVFDSDEFLDTHDVAEHELPEDPALFRDAYPLTKWVSERHVLAARARGLDASVYRPGNITGDSRTGYWMPGDLFTRALRAVALTGLVPDADIALDLTPVDFVARGLVRLALSRDHRGGAWHLVSPVRVPAARLADWSRAAGLDVRPVPLPAFAAAVKRVAAADPADPVAALAMVLAGGTGGLLETVGRRCALDLRHTLTALRAVGVEPPAPSAEAFARAVERLMARGYLPADTGRAAAE